RVSGTIHPDQRETIVACRRTHGAHRLVAGEDSCSRFRRRALKNDPYRSGARGAAMLHPRHHFLPDIAALVEIDAVQPVHIGLMRERIAIHEVEPAARHAGRDTMRFVGSFVDEISADYIGYRLLQFLRHMNAPAERLVAWIPERQLG